MNCCIRVKGITEVIAVQALTTTMQALHRQQAVVPEIVHGMGCTKNRHRHFLLSGLVSGQKTENSKLGKEIVCCGRSARRLGVSIRG